MLYISLESKERLLYLTFGGQIKFIIEDEKKSLIYSYE